MNLLIHLQGFQLLNPEYSKTKVTLSKVLNVFTFFINLVTFILRHFNAHSMIIISCYMLNHFFCPIKNKNHDSLYDNVHLRSTQRPSLINKWLSFKMVQSAFRNSTQNQQYLVYPLSSLFQQSLSSCPISLHSATLGYLI